MTDTGQAGAVLRSPAARIDAVGVVVSEMAAAVRFYERLGCTFPAGAAQEDHAEADLGGVRLMLDDQAMLVQIGFFDADAAKASYGRVAFAARLGTAAEVDALYAALAADGFGVREPFDAPWGQRYATVADPDGTHVDLYAATS